MKSESAPLWRAVAPRCMALGNYGDGVLNPFLSSSRSSEFWRESPTDQGGLALPFAKAKKNQTFSSLPEMFMLCSREITRAEPCETGVEKWMERKAGAGEEKAAGGFAGKVEADADFRRKEAAPAFLRRRRKQIIFVRSRPQSLDKSRVGARNGKIWKAFLPRNVPWLCQMARPGAPLNDNGFDFAEIPRSTYPLLKAQRRRQGRRLNRRAARAACDGRPEM